MCSMKYNHIFLFVPFLSLLFMMIVTTGDFILPKKKEQRITQTIEKEKKSINTKGVAVIIH